MATTTSASSPRSSAPARRSTPARKPASPPKSASPAKTASSSKAASSTRPASNTSAAKAPAAAKPQDRTSISSEARAGGSDKASPQVQNLTNGLNQNFASPASSAANQPASQPNAATPAAGQPASQPNAATPAASQPASQPNAAPPADNQPSSSQPNAAGSNTRGMTFVFPDGTEFKAGDNPTPTAEVLSGERQEGRRQVGVLDDFQGKGEAIAAPGFKSELSHGEASAQAQEKAGFGVTRIQQNGEVADSMTSVAAQIERNGILQKGDLLNVSMGEVKDPTFAQLSQATGLDLNRGNIGDQREQLFSRLNELKGDAGANKQLGGEGSIGRMLQTNEAVNRIQGQGVDVVHAAGNRGPDEVSVGFLNARHQLSGTNAAGQIEPYSANHQLTKPSQSTHEVRETYNPLTPHPIESGKGFALEASGGRIQEAMPGPSLVNQGLNVQSIEPSKIRLGDPTGPQHGSEVLSPTSFERTNVPLTHAGQAPVVGLAAGTSFANWDFIPNNFSVRN